ncbi:MAG: hypothetical protein O4861_08500 [Trichodesmium sp. St16_bin4-tuft]|nr:hypothetical protein [Trichodesmium sp. St4_bin8_1]MDE5072116.1 hypothetical protein [Trichodesmium sp. St5_bin8]MDE5076999.1 hypothetical protein [Trichodesmium sp. St2_bin6]MDE5092509.1 hypothetical protein [Trichodesmium sp. St18_bin3_1_1]MDE5093335.1 hypothetical protein [Trichodesmium sp. St11_bin5]MDE5098372.1 hypothetical protein [Trichodesmium sp. St16_bin4-tuft]MDE5101722.1 hypothetical protein [Trichodesmium sp. St19_bin2]MDT9339477.1 hypothetical protein [Trichodesmium erythrae
MPHELPSWQTVSKKLRKFHGYCVWEQMNHTLWPEARVQEA